ncbi:endolytic transglycosylase MltG [Microbacterium sp. STN6]|uniref:endolytic transglycosylase MltG n=1 Tax=Microbacterium sp. STN6 TaxID=2995588 RepID=UPI002260C5FC|nr:endolytic transglycosylase MltG [Microbacterium sp. STN6]MCX7521704.1 endolytic transglycosylase MltG [Microbacterium sp. STN6]
MPSPGDASERPLTRREAREAERKSLEGAETADARPASEQPPGVVPADWFARRDDEPTSVPGEADDPQAPAGPSLEWRQQQYPSRERQKRRRSLKGLWVTLIVIAILGGLVGGAYAIFQPQVSRLFATMEPNDYKGSGSGQVLVTIKSGDIGADVASTLHKAGVTKSYEAFYSLLVKTQPSPVFQPGAYKLAKKMSAKAALAALEDPANKVEMTAVIPEGTAEKDVLGILATATKLPRADLQKAADDVAAYGVPPEAKTLEGFLFPATYRFSPGVTAPEVIKTLVDRMFQALDAAGVAPADRWNIVVMASLVQREAGLAADYPKVARVFYNRLDQGWKLQSDATVAYGTGHTDRVTTTNAERADASNPYNTYQHAGLPPGPISNPGDVAINAALHPADGPWMFFVTWNLETGETIFSTTNAEHEAAVKKWQQWMRDHPNYG